MARLWYGVVSIAVGMKIDENTGFLECFCMLYSCGGAEPQIADDAYVAPTAAIVGRVSVGSGSSLWFSVVVRGDMDSIMIGDRTNIQDGTVVHVSTGHAVHIGNDVTIGHSCIIHGATIKDGAFIGMGSTILDGAVVEEGAVVASRSLVTSDTIVRAGYLWMGSPARPVRQLGQQEAAMFAETAPRYVSLGRSYLLESNV